MSNSVIREEKGGEALEEGEVLYVGHRVIREIYGIMLILHGRA